MALRNHVELEDIFRVKRPGIGYVYRGKITIGDLFDGLEDGLIKYSPKYQRGYRPSLNLEADPHDLVELRDDKLAIERWRAEAMAAKYLGAVNGAGKVLYNPDVVWNARKDGHRPDPKWDRDTGHLDIFTILTIPDSGHRHYAYWLLGTWKMHPEEIPDVVELDRNGETVGAEVLREWIKKFDPYDAEESSVLVEVFNLRPEEEGRLFDEYNDEGRAASSAKAIDLFIEKTPSRRFVGALMERCRIFARTEVETATNTIGSKSRKLTTNATLESAVRNYAKLLLQLEKEKREGQSTAYDDLVSFICEFYEEWARYYPEFLPSASAEARHALRRRSFALQNITFYPMIRMAVELWEKYRKAGLDWESQDEWRKGLARLAAKIPVEVDDPNQPGTKKTVETEVMARDSDDPPTIGNPRWRELVLVPNFDRDGKINRWTLSSTRTTREAAYDYLARVAELDLPRKRTRHT
jgi:DNA-sulfur modification-associated